MPTVNEAIVESEIDRLAALQEVDRRLSGFGTHVLWKSWRPGAIIAPDVNG